MLSTVKNGKRVWERGVFEGGLSRADLMSEWGWGGRLQSNTSRLS